ncbi:MAG: carbohydrate ABC transporter permease [Spirochaetales bacterium]
MPKKYKNLENIIFDSIVTAIMLLSLFICLVPFIYMLAVSLSGSRAILNGKVFLFPVDFTFISYQTIFNYPNFIPAYFNTFFYTVFGTMIALILNCLMAYPLSKVYLKGTKLVTKIVVATMFFTGGLIPNYLLISNLGLSGTRLAILLPFAINPFNLIVLISFFKGMPTEIEDAALIDGLNYFGILSKIVLPLSTAAIATIGLYYAVFFWNDWFNSLLYLNYKLNPVMMILRNIVNGTLSVGGGTTSSQNETISLGIKSAVIITSTLPIIITYPFLQKFFVKGITLGGVKS